MKETVLVVDDDPNICELVKMYLDDDYITKPFSPREMAARVKAVLRRTKSGKQENLLQYPGLVLNSESHLVKIYGQAVELTAKEFELLWLMAASPGKVFSRDNLLDRVWGYDYYGGTRSVDSQVKRLRRKIESIPGARTYIHTVWGVGYKFEV